MMHDIAHCNKSTCSKCDDCYRYLAYLEACEREYEYLTFIVQEEGKECEAYWEMIK